MAPNPDDVYHFTPTDCVDHSEIDENRWPGVIERKNFSKFLSNSFHGIGHSPNHNEGSPVGKWSLRRRSQMHLIMLNNVNTAITSHLRLVHKYIRISDSEMAKCR